MKINVRLNNVEQELKADMEVKRPVLMITLKDDKKKKIKEWMAQHPGEGEPEIRIDFSVASNEEITNCLLGRQ